MSVTTERYDIQTRLAVGCAGMVYRAIDRGTGFPVALKLFQTLDEFTHPLDVRAMMRNALRLRKLTGAHVAQLLDAVDDSEGPVLVYQYIEGESVATLPGIRRIEKGEAIDIAAQFLAAMECAEKTGMPHGDWKPSNVVIGKTDAGRSFVLVLDWGLASFRRQPTPDSLLFFAPERLAGAPASFCADIFSAGAVLHYLLSGRLLVGGEDRAGLAEAWKVVKPESLKELRPDLPPKFVEWLAWLMDVRPKKRPQSVAEARRALATFKPPPPPMAPRHLAWHPPTTAFQSSASRAPSVRVTAASRPTARPVQPVRPVRPPKAVAVASQPSLVVESTAEPVPTSEEAVLPNPPDVEETISAVAAEEIEAPVESEETSLPVNVEEITPAPEVLPVPVLIANAPAKKRWPAAGIAIVVILLGALTAEGLFMVRKHVWRPGHQADGTLAPSELEPLPPGAKNVWTEYEIGNPAKSGSSAFDSKTGIWTVNGGGADIWFAADQFHLSGERFAGDGELVARVTNVPKTNEWAKSGVMFRSSTAPAAAFAHMVASAGGQLAFQWRATDGAQASTALVPLHIPVWVKVRRMGDQFSGWYSQDGVKWTQLGATQRVSLPRVALAGLCVNAHNNAVVNATTFTNVSMTPYGWNSSDLGGPLPGGAIYDFFSKRWTIRGGGIDIWAKSDQFHFVWRDLEGDQTLQAQVTSIENTNPWVKTGVTFRGSATADAANVTLLETPVSSICFQWRAVTGGDSAYVEQKNVPAPVKLKLERKGNVFTAFFSKDGQKWTQIGVPQTVNMPAKAAAGYCAAAHDTRFVPTVVFDE